MISQKTLLHDLAAQVDEIAASEPHLGLAEVRQLPGLNMVTVQLRNLGGSPGRFMVLMVRDNDLQLRVHNVAHTAPPSSADNRAARLFLDDGPPPADDMTRRGLLGLHVESALRMARTPGDLVRSLAIASNGGFRSSRACHDPVDGELYVRADAKVDEGIPDDLEDLITQTVGQASMIITFADMVESVTEMSPGVSMPVDNSEIDDDDPNPPADGDEVPAAAGDGSESDEDWL